MTRYLTFLTSSSMAFITVMDFAIILHHGNYVQPILASGLESHFYGSTRRYFLGNK
jgi:hypothetical protein